MAYEANTGLGGVHNQYGPRTTGGNAGVERTTQSVSNLSIEFTGETLNNLFLPPLPIPKGALFRRAILRVDEAFNLTGTTPVVRFGASLTLATNNFQLSEAELETIGTKVPASVGNGTWAFASTTGTAVTDKVAVAMAGTSPVADATVGRATLILEFANDTLI